MRRIWEAADTAPSAPSKPTIFDQSARVRLDVITPADYDFLFQLALEAQYAWAWQGNPVSVDAFHASLWEGVADQRLIRTLSGDRLGLVSLYSVSSVHQTGNFRVFSSIGERPIGLSLEGAALFIDFCFIRFNLRKLYFESTADRVKQFASATDNLLEVEARYRDRLIFDGASHDLLVLTLDRARWLEIRTPLLRALRAQDSRASQ